MQIIPVSCFSPLSESARHGIASAFPQIWPVPVELYQSTNPYLDNMILCGLYQAVAFDKEAVVVSTNNCGPYSGCVTNIAECTGKACVIDTTTIPITRKLLASRLSEVTRWLVLKTPGREGHSESGDYQWQTISGGVEVLLCNRAIAARHEADVYNRFQEADVIMISGTVLRKFKIFDSDAVTVYETRPAQYTIEEYKEWWQTKRDQTREFTVMTIDITTMMGQLSSSIVQPKTVKLNRELFTDLLTRNLNDSQSIDSLIDYAIAYAHTRYHTADRTLTVNVDAMTVVDHALIAKILTRRRMNFFQPLLQHLPQHTSTTLINNLGLPLVATLIDFLRARLNITEKVCVRRALELFNKHSTGSLKRFLDHDCWSAIEDWVESYRQEQLSIVSIEGDVPAEEELPAGHSHECEHDCVGHGTGNIRCGCCGNYGTCNPCLSCVEEEPDEVVEDQESAQAPSVQPKNQIPIMQRLAEVTNDRYYLALTQQISRSEVPETPVTAEEFGVCADYFAAGVSYGPTAAK